MSNIFFLGQEDAEGLARLQNGQQGLLAFDKEVGGWDTPSNKIVYSDLDSDFRREIERFDCIVAEISQDKLPVLEKEPTFQVFNSRTAERVIENK